MFEEYPRGSLWLWEAGERGGGRVRRCKEIGIVVKRSPTSSAALI